MSMMTTVYTICPDVVLRKVAGERLLIPVRGNLADLQNLFVLEGVGERVWERLDGVRSVKMIAGEIAEICGAPQETVEKDCVAFLSELHSEGLVHEA